MKLWHERIHIMKSIWPYISDYRRKWGMLFILKFGQVLPGLIVPFLFKLFIDKVVEQKNFRFMLVISVLYICLYLFETVLKVGHRYLDNRLFNDITLKLRKMAWRNYLYMPFFNYKTYQISDLSKRLTDDMDMIKFFMIGEIFDYLTYVISLFISAVIIFLLDWRLSIILYLLLPISIHLSNKFQNQLSELHESGRKIITKIENWLQNSLISWKEIKANSFEKNQIHNYDILLQEQCGNENMKLSCMLRRNYTLDTKNLLLDQFLLFFIGGIMHFIYNSTVGTVLACIQYYNAMMDNLSKILEINVNLEWVKPSINRAIEMLNSYQYSDNENLEELNRAEVLYNIKHLNYSYEKNGQMVIKDLSLKINDGDKFIIKGISGRGKSTLLRILTGDLIPKDGIVLMCEKNITNIDQRLIYQKIRAIFQEPYFMNISIGDYLRLAKAKVSDEELESACKKACIMDFISSLPKGFNTVIGTKGGKLSGGQRQKLALARLFLIHNRIIFLDEAFSAIDGKDKITIIKELLQHFDKEAVICITHDSEIAGFFDKSYTIK